MKVLILGGTRFLGRSLVDAALASGHEVTLFNRGQTNPDIYPDVERLIGDRDGDLAALDGRTWDVAIDTCGYVPRIVGLSATHLAERVAHYTFISSISVYDESVHETLNMNENGPVAKLEDETVEDISGGNYGGLKVLCEQAAEKAMPGRVLQVRSGLIVGPHDPTDRFTYWPVRVSRGGKMLAPPEDSGLQIIDVRDLSEWIIRMAEQRKAGTYNVTGPNYRLTYGEVIATSQQIVGQGAAEAVVATEAFLLENDVQPWMTLPLWLPSTMPGMTQINVEKAKNDGLSFRSLETTIADTLNWFNRDRADDPNLRGQCLSSEREAELLTLWETKN